MIIRLLLDVLGHDYARPLRRTVSLMTAAAIAEGLLYALLVPLLRALLGGNPAHAWPWVGALAAACIAYGLLRYASDLSSFRMGATLLGTVYHRLGDHLARLPIGWFARSRLGETTALASQGVVQAMGVVAHLLGPFVSASVTPLVTVAVITCYHWPLGLAAGLGIPVVAWAHRWTKRVLGTTDAARAHTSDVASERVIEFIQAQPVLRAGGRVTERFALLDDALLEVRADSRRTALAVMPGMVGLSLTVQAVFTALLVAGAYLVLNGGLDAATLLAIMVLAARCTGPVLSLAELGGGLRGAQGELERLASVLDATPLSEPADPAEPAHYGLEALDVTLRRGETTVLDRVSFSVPPGQRLAVVGPSGAGKSTLLQLIARFHDTTEGTVCVGGKDVRAIGTEALMPLLGLVSQDVYLFDDTLEANVRMGRPGADDDAVRAASSAAHLDEVVARLPLGWATNVGEGGSLLSGGERQRVSIARALLKDAPILLLDEITSALDSISDAAVHDGIERLMAERTVVMVAHRLSTVLRADRVVFLERGRVVADGTHHELMQLNERYATFWSASVAPVEHDAG